MVMLTLSRAHTMYSEEAKLTEKDQRNFNIGFFILLCLNGFMILVLTLFSARWATKITGSIKVLNDFVNNLKIAQDKDDKNEVVSKISEN